MCIHICGKKSHPSSNEIFDGEASSWRKTAHTVGLVFFGIALILCALSPLYTTVGTTGFHVACGAGVLSLLGLIFCLIQSCNDERKSEWDGLENDDADDDYYSRYSDLYNSSNASSTSPSATNTFSLKRELPSPFSLKLWAIARQHSFSDSKKRFCPRLRLEYQQIKKKKSVTYYVNSEGTIQIIDKILGELKTQKELFTQKLNEFKLEPADLQKNSELFNEAIKILISALEDRKEVLLNHVEKKKTIFTESEKNALSSTLSDALFKPLVMTMLEIESNLGIQKAFSDHIRTLVQNIADGTELPYALQLQTEICREYFCDRDASLSVDRFSPMTESTTFNRLFRSLFMSYEVNDSSDGLKMSPEVKFINIGLFKEQRIRKDGAIEGSYAGQKWVLLSCNGGGGAAIGHFANNIYSKTTKNYLELDNIKSKPSSKESTSLFYEINDSSDIQKKPWWQANAQIKKSKKEEEQQIQSDRRYAEQINKRNFDIECVIMQVEAFERCRESLTLPRVIPPFYMNNCYLAAALVRLAAFYQAVSLCLRKEEGMDDTRDKEEHDHGHDVIKSSDDRT